MPALPPAPATIRVDILYSIGSDLTALDRLFIAYTGAAPTSAQCVTLAAALYVIFAAEIAVFMGGDNALEGVRVTDLASPTGGQGEHLQHTVGAAGGGPLGANVAGLASGKIGRRYRGGKPRTYFPVGSDIDMATPQTWLASFVTNMQAALDAIRADIAVTSAGATVLTHLVNVSYYSGFTVRPDPPIPGVRAKNIPTLRGAPVIDPYISWTFEPKLASQRRRLQRQP
jgi:hypothetical protein